MAAKTIVIWDDGDQDIKFFILPTFDDNRFDGVYIGMCNNRDLQTELCDLVFNEDGSYKVEMLERFPTHKFNRYDAVIVAGIIP